MTKSASFRLAVVLGGIVAAAACQSPTEPTESDVTLTGAWSGAFTGNLLRSDAVTANLTHTDVGVTGTWSMPMPATLVAFGAPAGLELSGPVAGTVTGTTAELEFLFEGFRQYFAEGCAVALSVASFDATMLEGSWTTNASCQPPVEDSGTMTMTRR